MNIGFSVSESHSVQIPDTVDLSDHFPKTIHQHSGWKYSCEKTEDGYFLKPIFRDMPYRNSFVPEISVGISPGGKHHYLTLKGRPVKFVRGFMNIWFAGLLLLEVFMLVLAICLKLDRLFPVFIPVGMCIFGYLLCKIATKVIFRSVVKAILKGFP